MPYSIEETADSLSEIKELVYNEIITEIRNGTDTDIIVGLIELLRTLSC